MAKLSIRVSFIDAITSLVERSIEHWPTILVLLAGGSSMGWAAVATEWLAKYDAIAWVTSAWVGLLLAAWFLAGLARMRLWAANKEYFSALTGRKSSINPLDQTFNKERIYVSDFQNPFHEAIENKTFTSCDLIGPGIVVFDGGSVKPTNWVGCENFIINDRTLYNAVVFKNCNFIDGKFYGLTILVLEEHYEVFNIPGVTWRTPVPEK